MHEYRPINIYTGESNGEITVKHKNPAISQETLSWLRHVQQEGVSFEDAIDILRQKTVPEGHKPHPWTEGMYYNYTSMHRTESYTC